MEQDDKFIIHSSRVAMLAAAARLSEHEATQWLKSHDWDYHAAVDAQAAHVKAAQAAAAQAGGAGGAVGSGGAAAAAAASTPSAIRALVGMRTNSADLREVAEQLEPGDRAPIRMSSHEAAAEIDAEVRYVMSYCRR